VTLVKTYTDFFGRHSRNQQDFVTSVSENECHEMSKHNVCEGTRLSCEDGRCESIKQLKSKAVGMRKRAKLRTVGGETFHFPQIQSNRLFPMTNAKPKTYRVSYRMLG
jgi:hypothetical protein